MKVYEVLKDNYYMKVVIGGSIVDFIATVKEPEIKFTGMTHRGQLRQSYGGVGRNLADALARMQCHPLLVSAVGTDSHAQALINHNPLLETRGLARVESNSTAVYCVVLDHKGEALFGVGDMSVHEEVTPDHVKLFEADIAASPLVVLDGNMSQRTINYTLDLCEELSVPVWYEPTDVQKASKPWLEGRGDTVRFTSPNLNELRAICSQLDLGLIPDLSPHTEDQDEILLNIVDTVSPLLQTMDMLMVTLGQHGFLILRHISLEDRDTPVLSTNCNYRITHDEEATKVIGLHFPGPQRPKIVSVSGAGDCLAAGFIAGMLHGRSISECSALGVTAATYSLAASPAVPTTLTAEILPWGEKHPYRIIA